MLKIYGLIFFVTILLTAKSQVTFCPPGAKWNYFLQDSQQGPSGTRNEKIVYIRDSLIGNDTVKVIQHQIAFVWSSPTHLGYTYLKQTGDTIWFKNEFTNEAWQILYNFNCPPGNYWSTTLQTASQGTYTVKSTVIAHSNTVINGYSLRTMSIVFDSSQAPVKDSITITERLGAETFVFYHYSDPAGGDERYPLCYSDSTFGTLQFTSLSCDYSNPSAIEETIEQKSALIFPNPANDQVTIFLHTVTGPCQVSLLDISGKTVVSKIVKKENATVNLDSLENGLYFLKIIADKSMPPVLHKLVVAR